jgi:hypothetical protein
VRLTLLLLLSALLAACGGIQSEPDDTAGFVATGYSRYAWRSDPMSEPTSYRDDKPYVLDQALRAAVDARLAELGYQRVEKDQAQFLVDYIAAVGVVDGRLSSNASNVTPLPSGTINRQINQAEVDNAYALGSGARETGNVALVFVERGNLQPLWKVMVSSLIENVNEVDRDQVARAMRRGLATLPPAPQ